MKTITYPAQPGSGVKSRAGSLFPRVLFSIFLILSALDLISTIIGIEIYGLREANPVAVFFISQLGYLGLIIMKSFHAAISYLLCLLIDGKLGSPGPITFMFAQVCVLAAVVASNTIAILMV